jgi:hypothetical protein
MRLREPAEFGKSNSSSVISGMHTRSLSMPLFRLAVTSQPASIPVGVPIEWAFYAI